MPVSVEGNSTGDVITGALKASRLKALVCMSAKRKSIRDNFLEISVNFKATLRNLVWNSFAEVMQIVNYKPASPVKS